MVTRFLSEADALPGVRRLRHLLLSASSDAELDLAVDAFAALCFTPGWTELGEAAADAVVTDAVWGALGAVGLSLSRSALVACQTRLPACALVHGLLTTPEAQLVYVWLDDVGAGVAVRFDGPAQVVLRLGAPPAALAAVA